MATLQKKPKKKSPFDAQVFLESVGVSRRVVDFRKNQPVFSHSRVPGEVALACS
jgi:hypothetical protein